MSAAQGRFTSPDPIYFQKEMLTDPQRWNLYAYTGNNPLRFVDPKGEAIELEGDEEERRKALEALRTNGPDANGPAFDKINTAAASLGSVIQSQQVVTLGLVSNGTTLTNDRGEPITIGSINDGRSPGVTSFFSGGKLSVFILDPSTNPGQLPASKMQPSNAPGSIDQGILALHELGHAGYIMGALLDQNNNKADCKKNKRVYGRGSVQTKRGSSGRQSLRPA